MNIQGAISKKRRNVIGGICTILTIGVIVVIGQFRNCNIKKDGAYIIGNVTDYTPSGNGAGMHYEYNYQGSKHKSVATISYMMMSERPKGTKLLIVCKIQNPQKVLVIDTIPSWFTLEAPSEGWKEQPTEAQMREMMVQDSIKRGLRNIN